MPDAPYAALWPFTGRDSLGRAVTDALLSGRKIVLLIGSSGVGKSRLATEVADDVRARGWSTLQVSGSTIMSNVPLGALTPMFSGDRPSFDAAAASPGTLLQGAIEALTQLAPSTNRLLVVDDLGLLDPLSATVVAQLVASGLLRLLATARSGEPIPDPIMSIWASDQAVRLDVPPLALSDYEALLPQVLGGPVAHRAAAELLQATGGNPLYLRELVLGALDAGQLVNQAGVWQLVGEPVGSLALRDLTLSRLRHLDEDERDVVDRLALCGELEVNQLRGSGARAAVERLESAGLVEITPTLGVRLAHPQYGAIIASSLSRLRRADLLLDQADILAAAGSSAADELRLVMWRLAAGVATDPELLVSAARLAHQAGDWPTVERLASAALDAGGPRPDYLMMRGEAQLRMGRSADALETLQQAAAIAPRELVTPIAAIMAMAHVSVHEGLDAGLRVIQDAERAVGADPGLALTRAQIELFNNNPLEADQILRELDGAFGDSPAERAIIAAARAQPLAALGHVEESLAAARVALEFARATGGRAIPGHTVANALHTLGVVHLHAGEFEAAQAVATEALVESLDTDDEIVARSIEFLLGRIAADTGRLDSAERWFRDTMSGALTSGPMSLYIPAVGSLAIVKAMRGDLDGARSDLGMIPAGVYVGAGGEIAQAWLSALTGDLPTASREIRVITDRYTTTGQRYLASVMLFGLARMGGAADAAAGLAALAAESSSPFIRLQATHVGAEVAGDRARLVETAEEWESRGARLWAAEAYSSAARAARRAEEHRAAAALQVRADELAAQCEGASTPLLQFSEELAPLTRREREIAALAAQGASSKEIAERLFLSTRTVDNHLQSIYGKLGIRGRHELHGSLS